MLNEQDKEIVSLLNRREFSELEFLDDLWFTSENKSYIGLYYFLQHLREENKESVFEEIVKREGSHSMAYLYIGKISKEIYRNFIQDHIPKYYFRLAIQFDNNNSEAHWKYYWLTRDTESLFQTIKIDYENNNFEELQHKLHNVHLNQDFILNFSKEYWGLIKKVCRDERVVNIHNQRGVNYFLILTYYYLGEFDEGISLIEDTDKISLDILRLYLDKNLISLDQALLKLNSWEKDEILKGDHKRIYIEFLKEAESNKAQHLRDVFLKKAYYAGEYEDVLLHFNNIELSKLAMNSTESNLYYLLSQLALGQNIDQDKKNFVESRINLSLDEGGESEELYLILKFKLIMDSLKKQHLGSRNINHTIDVYGEYQSASKILEKPSLIKSYFYDDLENELKDIASAWNTSYFKDKFDESKSSFDLEKTSKTDLWEHCSLAIECKNYDYVIGIINEHYKNNSPSMKSENILGVCYEFKENYFMALGCFKKSIDLMYKFKELSYVIINNYINVAKKIDGYEIPENEFDKLKNDFNISLVGKFKWSHYCSDRFNILYKYSPFNINTIDSLANQYFYLPNKDKLNDPIEFPQLSALNSDSLIHKEYNICSFSNNQNSILMWSHYAEQHKGIMVEYWFGGEFPEGFGISKLDYSDSFKRQKEKDFYVFNQYILTKNKEWSYENEVRLFSPVRNKVGFTSYEYTDFDRSKINARICSITLGYKFPEDKIGLISNLIKTLNMQRKSYENKITMKRAYIDEFNNFSLIYKDIEIL